MGRITDDRPAYLSSDDAKYSLGVHRGPLMPVGGDEGSKLEQVESAGGSRWQRPIRFWCCYLIGNVIFLAIFLPVFFLVAIPAISQLVVDKSDLVLVNAAVMQPRPDSIQLTLQSALDLKVALDVRIEPINLALFIRNSGAGEPWANARIDGKIIKGNTTLGIEDVHTPIVNSTTWYRYVHNTIFQKETALSVRGTTNSYLGVLKSQVTMDKDIISPTLNQFKGFSVEDSTLLLKPYDNGTNLLGTAVLPNPSVLTLDIGTLFLDVKSGDLVIGNATVENLLLKPGENKHPLTGILDLHIIFQNLKEVLATQAKSIRKGVLSLDTVTRSVVWNGTLVPYYTKAMSELTLTADVALGDILKNTIHAALHGNATSLLEKGKSGSGNGSSLISELKQKYEATKDKNVLHTRSDRDRDSARIAEALKQNIYMREVFKGEDPAKRDSIIDTLSKWYTKL
ncbi:hypothetical protein N7492_006706 [Penicillium capsulatum]|uniref:Uncharacterized protein n=1 Tax=Penicillium capsulatum TaxID=69766 RepID=A0A9W9LKY8_9EURO|nr:hypothetical protein N7492_006706 [Penicillium capsulatum]KAJ6116541.1 hypothetical protein N7512_006266 [Penicillium capsulatum]